MANVENFNVEQFLQWLSHQDLTNISNHDNGGAADGAEDQDEIVNTLLEDDEDDVVEGVEPDCENMDQESADAIYYTTVFFVKVPTEAKDYLLCQLCYWRYLDRCHPPTNHRQASVHKTTTI